MSENKQPISKPKSNDKKERLAKALRENLLRRKAWQKAQKEKKEEKSLGSGE